MIPVARAAMEDQRTQSEGIATNTEPATVWNTVVAFDESNDVTNHALAPAFTLFSSMGGPELEKIQATLGPALTVHTNAFWLDRRMFERFEAVDLSEADEETHHFVEDTFKKFRLKGIDMSEEEQAKLKEIDSQLSCLEILFSQRATKAMDDNALIVHSRDGLAGLSDEQIASFEQEAGTFRIPLLNFTNQPLQADLPNPATRRALLDASIRRGLGDFKSSDTRQLVVDIAKLRAERATLLGQPHHAQVVAMKGMAGDSQSIIDLLTSVASRAVQAVDREQENLRALVEDDPLNDGLEAGDWAFYQEKLRGQVTVGDSALKPYLALSNVVEKGIYYAAEKLFGLTFTPRPDIAG